MTQLAAEPYMDPDVIGTDTPPPPMLISRLNRPLAALRNVQDTVAAIRELGRVTRPGGRLVVCEFSHPTHAAFRTVYLRYLMRSLPTVARRVSSNPDAYVYLAESIRAWPDQAGLAGRITAAGGWSRVGWRNLTGGVVALHRATRD